MLAQEAIARPSNPSEVAACHPLRIDVYVPRIGALAGWQSPPVNGYDRSHGREGAM